MSIIGRNQNVVKLNLVSASGRLIEAIYFGDTERFMQFLRDKFSEEERQRALRGQPNSLQLSIAYEPKVNEFRGMENLQFEIKYYC